MTDDISKADNINLKEVKSDCSDASTPDGGRDSKGKFTKGNNITRKGVKNRRTRLKETLDDIGYNIELELMKALTNPNVSADKKADLTLKLATFLHDDPKNTGVTINNNAPTMPTIPASALPNMLAQAQDVTPLIGHDENIVDAESEVIENKE